MRSSLCLILSVMLFCALVVSSGVPEALPPLSKRQSAWFSLLCPAFFTPAENAPADDRVTFTWPLFERVIAIFRLNA